MAVQKKGTTKKKKITTKIDKGIVHINSTFNNTLVTISDTAGNVVSWSSAGSLGYKGNKKRTPYAASQVAETAATKAKEYGIKVKPGINLNEDMRELCKYIRDLLYLNRNNKNYRRNETYRL